MTFGKCRQMSRHLEQYIDEKAWLGEKYILEVSSPGIERPLQLRRQYLKNIGRKLTVKLWKDGDVTGKLTKVEGDMITLEETKRIKEGKEEKKR